MKQNRIAVNLALALLAIGVVAPAARAEDEVWAIRCVALDGPDRAREAKRYADALKKVRGLDPELVAIQEAPRESVVFYGRYQRAFSFSKQPNYRPDPKKDLELIRSLSMQAKGADGKMKDIWPFQMATVESLPKISDIARWEIHNAPGKYSLQIGVFYNTEGMNKRQEAAEEYCKLLRQQGEEAYFNHGASMSIVTIGSFGEEAIKTEQREDPLTGRLKVTSKIVDERFLKLQEKYPNNLHNGHMFYDVVDQPGKGRSREPHVSFAVEIPREAATMGEAARP